MSVKWHRFCCCACVCYSSLSPCTTLPFNHSSIQCVYGTQQPDNFFRKFIQMGKGHRKMTCQKLFDVSSWNFKYQNTVKIGLTPRMLLPQNKCKKRKKKEKNPASLTSTLYSSGILPVINAIFSHENVWRFLSHSHLLFRWQSFFSAVFLLPVNFSVFSLFGKKAPQPHHEIFPCSSSHRLHKYFENVWFM